MPKVKIPRKSTNIDMTAMCDVAFLLLSFFILATKTKPPEAVQIDIPSSVKTEVASDKAIVVSLAKDGKVYLLLNDESHKAKIIDKINANRQLGLNDDEKKKLARKEFIGMPLPQLKGWLDSETAIPVDQMPGIPVQDSANNELTDWIRAVSDAYAGEDSKKMEILVKGDNKALYPFFKDIKTAFKKNDIFKFKIITNPEGVPTDSELFRNPPKPDK